MGAQIVFPRVRQLSGLNCLLPVLLCLLLVACDSIEERIADHFAKGQGLVEAGEPDKALLEFRNVLQLDDKHAPSYFAMAQIFEARGELQPAFRNYEKAAELDPQNGEARVKLARFYVISNAFEAAERELAAVFELLPNNADAHALKASIALRQKNPAAAKPWLEKAIAMAPGGADVALIEISYLLQTAGPAAAVTRAETALSDHPEQLALHLVKMQILEQMDDQTGIGVQLGVMVETFPEEPRFRQARAEWALRNEDMETAEAEMRAIVSALPENREALVTLIRFLNRQHGVDVARTELAQQIAQASNPFPLELMLAQFDIEAGRTEAAIAYLRELIERGGDNANQARVALAQLLARESRLNDAYALVDEILAEDPANVDALVMHVARQIDNDQLDKAIQSVRLGLREAPEDVRLLLLAARAQERSGNIDLANDRLAKAVRNNNYDPQTVTQYVQFLQRINRTSAADTVLTEALQRQGANPLLLELMISIRLRLENWPGAEQAIQALEPQDAERARQLRAALLIGQERFDEGASLLRDLPSDQQRRAASVAALVQAYLNEGKTEQATVFLDELLAENPENLQALGIRGNLFLATGNMEAAEAAYHKILEINPANGGAHSALARLYAQRGDSEASEQALLDGLSAAPDSVLLLTRLAQLREAQGQIDEAIELYDRVYRFIPNSTVIANNLAALLADHRTNDPDEVDRAYTIAGRLRDSERPEYQDTYGWTRYLKGDHEEALDALLPALQGLPNNPWVQYHVGMTYAKLERPAEARPHLEAALKQSARLSDFPPKDKIQETLDSFSAQ